MGFLNKITELAGIEEIDDDDEELEEEQPVRTERPASLTAPRTLPQHSEAAAAAQPRTAASASSRYSGTAPIKMVGIEPQSFDESPRLVDSLKAKKPVIINLENLETDVARKIFDFLSGATYALNGNVRKVANNIFVFAPENVEVTMNQKPSAAAQQEHSPWK